MGAAAEMVVNAAAAKSDRAAGWAESLFVISEFKRVDMLRLATNVCI